MDRYKMIATPYKMKQYRMISEPSRPSEFSVYVKEEGQSGWRCVFVINTPNGASEACIVDLAKQRLARTREIGFEA